MDNLIPVFIMGVPRSGTTLCASILAVSDEVISLPEMHYIHNLIQKELVFGEVSHDETKNILLNHFMFTDLEIVRNINEIDDIIGTSVKETIKKIISKYNEKYHKKDYGFWIEHSPYNHRYYLELSLYYKKAKFIFIVRDGRSVFRSLKNTDWGYQNVFSAAKQWRDTNICCEILLKSYPDKVYRVKYENLVNKPRDTVIDICNFIGAKYDDSLLRANGLRQPTYSKYQNKIGSKPDSSSINLWKKDLKKNEIEYFTDINSDLLEYYDYPIEGIPKYKKKHYFKCLLIIYSEAKRIILKKIAYKRHNRKKSKWS